MAELYSVKRYQRKDRIVVDVPGSKSITNRALMLAALSNGECFLNNVLFSDDSRAFLDCLRQLGFQVNVKEESRRVTIQGLAGKIPNRNARINVRSAGTAARFLTVMLAFAGGNYVLESSEQMKKRPMEPLLSVLRDANVRIDCMEEEGHFPFRLQSDRIDITRIAIDTNISSQFASALLMAGILLPNGLQVDMLGSRKFGAYIKITLRMMEQFGIPVVQNGSECSVPGKYSYGLDSYDIEPDLSGACYFYAMAPLLRTDVIVRKVHLDSIQGDIQFLHVLKQLGCTLEETELGTLVRGSHVESYEGITIDMKDFSDQTMTMAVLSPFATSPTLIRNVGHIRFQESDRISAIVKELSRMGIKCEEVKNEEGIRIYPGDVKPTTVETYEDHRMAMAFTLIGLRVEGIRIADPSCCVKTFENYFDIIDELVGE